MKKSPIRAPMLPPDGADLIPLPDAAALDSRLRYESTFLRHH
jgi:hypothetical protein